VTEHVRTIWIHVHARDVATVDMAAARIQSLYRGWRMRRHIATAITTVDIWLRDYGNPAAVHIQARFRGWRTLTRVAAFRAARADGILLYTLRYFWTEQFCDIGYATRPYANIQNHIRNEALEEARTRHGIARMLTDKKKAPNARLQRARKAAATVRWGMIEAARLRAYYAGYISVRNSGVVLITNYADYPCRKTRVHDDAFLEDPDDYLSEYSDDDSRPKQDIAKAKCHPLSASRRPVSHDIHHCHRTS
jgi:hypothetical protein